MTMGNPKDVIRHKKPTRVPHGVEDYHRLKGTVVYPGMFPLGMGSNNAGSPDPDNDGDVDTPGVPDVD